MIELSTEEKAKRYDEAIEKLRSLHDDYDTVSTLIDIKEELENIFPELKENEDEKIRKTLIYHYQGDGCLCSNKYRIDYKEIRAWLEKQGEQKPVDKVEPKFKVGDWIVCNNGSHPIFQVIERSWPNAKYRNINGSEIFLNVNTLDKQYHLWTIQDAKDGDVLSYRGGQWIFIYKEKIDDKSFSYYTLYSTVYQDLKLNDSGFTLLIDAVVPATKEQRDLLFQKMKEVGYEWDAEKKELKKIEQKQVITYPDNLPKDNWELIHEFVNKFGRIPKDEDELNVLIEYVLKRQKAALSEEDETKIKSIIAFLKSPALCAMDGNKGIIDKSIKYLKSLKERVFPQPKQEWGEEDKEQLDRALYMMEQLDMTKSWDDVYNWLKSLRPQNKNITSKEFEEVIREIKTCIAQCNGFNRKHREEIFNLLDSLRPQNTWKPSDEQMKCLDNVKGSDDHNGYVLNTLYNDLKKLKEEQL